MSDVRVVSIGSSVRNVFVRLLGRMGTNEAATSLTCLAFLIVMLSPVIIITEMILQFDYWYANNPDFWVRMLLDLVAGSTTDFSRLTVFVTPLFAILAGLKTRSGSQSGFFFICVCLCLFGIVGSLLAKYFVADKTTHDLLVRDEWIGIGIQTDHWVEQAKAFFDGLFQTFLGFMSILLGLRVSSQ